METQWQKLFSTYFQSQPIQLSFRTQEKNKKGNIYQEKLLMANYFPSSACSLYSINVSSPHSVQEGRLMYQLGYCINCQSRNEQIIIFNIINSILYIFIIIYILFIIYLQTLQANHCKQSSRTCTLISFSCNSWHVCKQNWHC